MHPKIHRVHYFTPQILCVCVIKDVVKELFSQFGTVKSVELSDHPGSLLQSGPKLSRFFKPAEKQVDLQCFS